MMAFHPSNSNYTSPRRERRSRQTHTYRTPASNQANLNGAGEALTPNPRLQSSPLRLPCGTSLNLLSRISKFEALDALSLPIKFLSLRPQHLQISRNSSSRRGTEASQARRLSTIFSPSTECREQAFPSEDDFTSGPDTLGSSRSRTWLPASKRSNSIKLQKSPTSYKSSSIRMHRGIWEPGDACESKGIGAMPAPYLQKKHPSTRKTIREMIKFYDGSTENFVSNGNAHLETLGLTNDAFEQQHQKGATLRHGPLCSVQ
jgi:hypothetical protein